MYTELENRVLDCISLRQEGESWDYKKEWYIKKHDLLLDIICMSNLVGSEDGIIIIGCDEENGHQLNDVENDPNRRDTAKVVDFLREKRFAGGVRPVVYVHPMCIQGITIDVIVVKNTRNTPYYLTESFGEIRANHIYTRVMDTNTPRDKSADPDRVEKLWKKRFALDASALEKAQYFLSTPDDWDSVDGAESYFCKIAPEFTITTESDDRDGYEYFLFNQMDKRPHWYNIYLKYHQTTIYSTLGVGLDGGRYFTPCPEIEGFRDDRGDYHTYRAFTVGSMQYELNRFFYKKEKSGEEEYCRKQLFECVAVFSSEIEKRLFETYLVPRYRTADIPQHLHMPIFPDSLPHGQRPEVFAEDFEKALKIQGMLELYRIECAADTDNVAEVDSSVHEG